MVISNHCDNHYGMDSADCLQVRLSPPFPYVNLLELRIKQKANQIEKYG